MNMIHAFDNIKSGFMCFLRWILHRRMKKRSRTSPIRYPEKEEEIIISRTRIKILPPPFYPIIEE